MYKIKTPNPHYNGKALGVDFIDGCGQTENEEIKNVLINDFGYSLCEEVKQEELKEVQAESVEEVKEQPKKESKKEKQSPKKEGE